MFGILIRTKIRWALAGDSFWSHKRKGPRSQKGNDGTDPVPEKIDLVGRRSALKTGAQVGTDCFGFGSRTLYTIPHKNGRPAGTIQMVYGMPQEWGF